LERGIDFRDAIDVFDDPERLEAADERRDYGERRNITIGLGTRQVVLTVVYTDRGDARRSSP
jgi:uncharacterized DUF497 family protein